MLSSANYILQSVFSPNTCTESACFTSVCHAFLVRHDCLCISKCTICYGVLHRFYYQLYTEKENRLYMHVLKSYAHIGNVLSSFKRRLSSQIPYFNANCMPLGLSTCMYNDIVNRISMHLLLITACTSQITPNMNMPRRPSLFSVVRRPQ